MITSRLRVLDVPGLFDVDVKTLDVDVVDICESMLRLLFSGFLDDTSGCRDGWGVVVVVDIEGTGWNAGRDFCSLIPATRWTAGFGAGTTLELGCCCSCLV